RELHVWRTLLHKNISPFYGVVLEATGEVGMVSPFYSNGNVLKYVKLNQHINPVEMVRRIADGIAYLHVKRIVHGDIKCANVMVTDEGIPRLIDFGLTQVIDEYAEATGYTTSNLASSLRWSAPELLVGDSPISSKSEKSDVYAFASTCIEIMTLECPYVGLRDPQVLQRVLMDNKIPARPPMEAKWSPSDELWDFLTTCWRKDREDRPNIVAVQRKLAEFYHGVAPGSSTIRQLR
ncbi:kinase-like protein, partial [Ramaria rubella]